MQDDVSHCPRASSTSSRCAMSLRALRTQIPDTPSLNPIVNVAFDLSRRLEAGEITFEELKALAGRLMDRACVQRARRLRERDRLRRSGDDVQGFHDLRRADGEATPTSKPSRPRWERARTGIVLTAHPTFGLSDALSRRIVEIAVSDRRRRHADRPAAPARQTASRSTTSTRARRTRSAICATPTTSCSTRFYQVAVAALRRQGLQAAPEARRRSRPGSATISTAAPTSRGRFSFLIRLREKRRRWTTSANASSPSSTRLASGDGSAAAVAPDHRQARPRDRRRRRADRRRSSRSAPERLHARRRPPTSSRAADGYNLVSAEPLIDAVRRSSSTTRRDAARSKRAIAGSRGPGARQRASARRTFTCASTRVQLNNAFRAFVHEPWTRDLDRAPGAGAHRRDDPQREAARDVNFETLDLETATAIRQFALAAQIQKHVDRETPIRFLIAECESPATMLIARVLRQAVRRRRHRRHLAVVRDARSASRPARA